MTVAHLPAPGRPPLRRGGADAGRRRARRTPGRARHRLRERRADRADRATTVERQLAEPAGGGTGPRASPHAHGTARDRPPAAHGHPQRHARQLLARRAGIPGRGRRGARAGAGRGRCGHRRCRRRVDPARCRPRCRSRRSCAASCRWCERLAEAGVTVSIDTRKARVMAEAVAAGARIINDVSGLTHDPEAPAAAAASGAGVVLMHLRDEPATMNRAPSYRHARARGLRRAGGAAGTARGGRHPARAGDASTRACASPSTSRTMSTCSATWPSITGWAALSCWAPRARAGRHSSTSAGDPSSAFPVPWPPVSGPCRKAWFVSGSTTWTRTGSSWRHGARSAGPDPTSDKKKHARPAQARVLLNHRLSGTRLTGGVGENGRCSSRMRPRTGCRSCA